MLLTQLRTLLLSDNQMTECPILTLPLLEVLKADGNALHSLPLPAQDDPAFLAVSRR